MFGELGFDKLLMLLVLFLLIFGSKRIPEIGRSLVTICTFIERVSENHIVPLCHCDHPTRPGVIPDLVTSLADSGICAEGGS